MHAVDPLSEYYVATARQAPGLAGRTGVHGQVDQILNELRIPAEVDKDGDWKLTTDVGPFLLIVDKQAYDLVAVQTIQPMEKVKKSADEMYVLLALNFEARGLARFGTLKDGGKDLLVLTARLAPDAVSRGSVEGMLTDCFRLSRRVDELLGNAPPEAPAQPGGWQAADAAIAQAEGNVPPAGQAPPAGFPPPEVPASTEPALAPPASPAHTVPGGTASEPASPAPGATEPGPAAPGTASEPASPAPGATEPGPAAPGTEPAGPGGAEPPEPEPGPAERPPPHLPPVEAPAAETVFAQPVPKAPAAESSAPATEPPAPAQPAPPAQSGQDLDFPPPQVDDPTLRLPPPGEPQQAYPPPAAQPAQPQPAQPQPAQPEPAQPDPAPAYPPPAQPSPPQQQLAPADWYPDPYHQARLRYWDGQSWTQHVSN